MPVIPLNQPELNDDDRRAVNEVMQRGRLVMGPALLEF